MWQESKPVKIPKTAIKSKLELWNIYKIAQLPKNVAELLTLKPWSNAEKLMNTTNIWYMSSCDEIRIKCG